MKLSTRALIQCSMFAALTAVLSQIAIPLPFTPVPINLATLAVLASGAILGAKSGAISQIVYMILGACGIPVFAQMTAGIGIILGPTGGYIIGYVAAAFVAGFITDRYNTSFIAYPVAIMLGTMSCYAFGTVWFMAVTGNSFVPSLIMCVIPFIPGDVLKIIATSLLASRLRPALHKSGIITA